MQRVGADAAQLLSHLKISLQVLLMTGSHAASQRFQAVFLGQRSTGREPSLYFPS